MFIFNVFIIIKKNDKVQLKDRRKNNKLLQGDKR